MTAEDAEERKKLTGCACSLCLGSANTNQGWLEFPICHSAVRPAVLSEVRGGKCKAG